MIDRKSASDDELPETGLPIDTEWILSATFIQHNEIDYGTRCSTALVIGHL